MNRSNKLGEIRVNDIVIIDDDDDDQDYKLPKNLSENSESYSGNNNSNNKVEKEKDEENNSLNHREQQNVQRKLIRFEDEINHNLRKLVKLKKKLKTIKSQVAKINAVITKANYNMKTISTSTSVVHRNMSLHNKLQRKMVKEKENDVWIERFSLKKRHKIMLRNHEPIDDCIIEAAQKLLSDQFPHIKGLQPTIYSQKLTKFKQICQGEDCIQIHYTDAFHWITSTNMNSNGKVRIFDSKTVKKKPLSLSVERQIARIYSNRKVKICQVQQQKGIHDCGIFAIAFAVELAFGGNPTKVLYKQHSMRQHLESILDRQFISPFPRSNNHYINKDKSKKHVTIKI